MSESKEEEEKQLAELSKDAQAEAEGHPERSIKKRVAFLEAKGSQLTSTAKNKGSKPTFSAKSPLPVRPARPAALSRDNQQHILSSQVASSALSAESAVNSTISQALTAINPPAPGLALNVTQGDGKLLGPQDVVPLNEGKFDEVGLEENGLGGAPAPKVSAASAAKASIGVAAGSFQAEQAVASVVVNATTPTPTTLSVRSTQPTPTPSAQNESQGSRSTILRASSSSPETPQPTTLGARPTPPPAATLKTTSNQEENKEKQAEQPKRPGGPVEGVIDDMLKRVIDMLFKQGGLKLPLKVAQVPFQVGGWFRSLGTTLLNKLKGTVSPKPEPKSEPDKPAPTNTPANPQAGQLQTAEDGLLQYAKQDPPRPDDHRMTLFEDEKAEAATAQAREAARKTAKNDQEQENKVDIQAEQKNQLGVKR